MKVIYFGRLGVLFSFVELAVFSELVELLDVRKCRTTDLCEIIQ